MPFIPTDDLTHFAERNRLSQDVSSLERLKKEIEKRLEEFASLIKQHPRVYAELSIDIYKQELDKQDQILLQREGELEKKEKAMDSRKRELKKKEVDLKETGILLSKQSAIHKQNANRFEKRNKELETSNAQLKSNNKALRAENEKLEKKLNASKD